MEPLQGPPRSLYWLPLGAGGHSVRLNGRVYAVRLNGRVYVALAARVERRACDLYHSALRTMGPRR